MSIIARPGRTVGVSEPVTSDRQERSRSEAVLSVIILVVASRALNVWFPTVGLVSDDRLTVLGRLVWPVLAAMSAFFVLRRQSLDRSRPDPWVLCCLAVVAMSALWSIDPARTVYQAGVLACVALCGWFLATTYRRSDLVSFAGSVLGAICLANAVGILAGLSVNPSVPAGFFEHKNILGLTAAIAFTLLFALTVNSPFVRWTLLLLIGSIAALALSGSRSSQFATVVAAAVILYLRVRRRSAVLALAVAFGMASVVAIALRLLGGIGVLLTASGRNATLTGRTEVWQRVIDLVGERPLLGWGFMAYWRDEGFSGAASGFEEFGHRSAHSGFLEVALGAGVAAGLFLFVVLLHLLLLGARRYTVGEQPGSGAALAAMAVLALILNLSESIFPSSVRTLLTLILIAMSARAVSVRVPYRE